MAAEVAEPHQFAQRKGVFDELISERHIVGILDRKRQLVFAQLDVEFIERFVTQVGVDDFRRSEFDLDTVIQFRSDDARQVQTYAFDKKGRRTVAPFVTGLDISRNFRQGGQHFVPGGRFGFEGRDFRRKLLNRRCHSGRVGLLRAGGEYAHMFQVQSQYYQKGAEEA